MKPTHLFQLPEDLPPQTALALFDLLSALTEAFWQQYQSELIPLIVNDDDPYLDSQYSFDDDLPPF